MRNLKFNGKTIIIKTRINVPDIIRMEWSDAPTPDGHEEGFCGRVYSVDGGDEWFTLVPNFTDFFAILAKYVEHNKE